MKILRQPVGLFRQIHGSFSIERKYGERRNLSYSEIAAKSERTSRLSPGLHYHSAEGLRAAKRSALTEAFFQVAPRAALRLRLRQRGTISFCPIFLRACSLHTAD